MSYIADIEQMAKAILVQAQALKDAEKHLNDWTAPERVQVRIGGQAHWTVRADGTVNPVVAGIYRETVEALQQDIIARKSRIEDYRFQLVQLGKVTNEN